MLDDVLELVLGVAGAELSRVGVHCEGHCGRSLAGLDWGKQSQAETLNGCCLRPGEDVLEALQRLSAGQKRRMAGQFKLSTVSPTSVGRGVRDREGWSITDSKVPYRWEERFEEKCLEDAL